MSDLQVEELKRLVQEWMDVADATKAALEIERKHAEAYRQEVACQSAAAAAARRQMDALRAERDALKLEMETRNRETAESLSTAGKVVQEISTEKDALAAALEAAQKALAILEAAPELNMNNYDEGQVDALNQAAIDALLVLRDIRDPAAILAAHDERVRRSASEEWNRWRAKVRGWLDELLEGRDYRG